MQIKEVKAGIKGGAIILLHDGHDLKTDSERPKGTIQMLPEIINTVIERGLQFVPVSELLGLEAYRK
jgi:peptidoglycan/xylan/chitin deacetylase (PgdA/CDA1 family)